MGHQQRINAMNDMTIVLDQNEEDLIINEISDEALETAVCNAHEKAGNYTLAACTGLTVCPG
jgi:hypothetical protein